MHNLGTSLRETIDTIRAVLSRGHWVAALALVGLAAITDQPAQLVLAMIGLLLCLVFLGTAMAALRLDPFSPWSVIVNLFRTPSWLRQGVAAVGLVATIAIAQVVGRLPGLSEWIAVKTDGDVHLTLCALVCSIAVLVSTCSLAWHRWQKGRLQALAEHGRVDDEIRVALGNAIRASRYWWSATELLILSLAALVPAALLANWAYNVLASILLPLFLLSAKHEHTRRGEVLVTGEGRSDACIADR